MSRELKFRVWSVKNNCFVTNGCNMSVLLSLEYEGAINSKDIYQQYTGLKDKNGNPIYEGDFIRGMFDHGPAGLREEILPVRWSNEDGYQWNYWDLSTIEVVGNEHEWPCHNPNSFDQNSECLTCDGWPSDCPFLKFSSSPKLILKQ